MVCMSRAEKWWKFTQFHQNMLFRNGSLNRNQSSGCLWGKIVAKSASLQLRNIQCFQIFKHFLFRCFDWLSIVWRIFFLQLPPPLVPGCSLSSCVKSITSLIFFVWEIFFGCTNSLKWNVKWNWKANYVESKATVIRKKCSNFDWVWTGFIFKKINVKVKA